MECSFQNKEFIGNLTSNLYEKFRTQVDKMDNYEFSLYNIYELKFQMQSKMVESIEEAIVSLFDELSQKHSWFPETSNNVHYYNGWATNTAHKINKKVIIPLSGYCTYRELLGNKLPSFLLQPQLHRNTHGAAASYIMSTGV